MTNGPFILLTYMKPPAFEIEEDPLIVTVCIVI